MTSGSNSTRGLIPGGYTPGNANTNTIDAITIASTGNSFDFGDLANPIRDHATFASSTRCILGGGTPSTNRIEFITISTNGNSVSFGNLTTARGAAGGGSNSIRGIFAGGSPDSGSTGNNTIDYITISTLGNAVDFGDLTQAALQVYNLVTSPTRGVRCGGNLSPGSGFTNVMDYITILTQGNAVDFGDLVRGDSKNMAGCSNAHGGL
jgi:hypothetical protein